MLHKYTYLNYALPEPTEYGKNQQDRFQELPHSLLGLKQFRVRYGLR
jgi:hypothetical protein